MTPELSGPADPTPTAITAALAQRDAWWAATIARNAQRRAELWADATQVEINVSPCGYLRDRNGEVIEPRAAISVMTPEGNLTFLGTASELAALAERFAAAVRGDDPAAP